MSAFSLRGPISLVRACKGAALAIALIIALPHPASAASCLPLLDRAPPLEVKLFAEDTSNVLHYALSDDTKLESKLTSYLATDPELLSVMRDLILRVPSSRRYTIGRSLGSASLHCAAVDPQLARKFSTYIGTLRDPDVVAGYISALPLNGVQLGTIGQSGPNASQFGTSGQAGPAGPQYGTSAQAAGPNPSGQFTGEFGMDLKNPFAEILLPQ
jgi:hypothetical protein